LKLRAAAALARWWSGAIANRIAAATALLIAALVLLLAGLAYASGSALLLRNADQRLGGYAELLANRLGLLLAGDEADARALASNALVVNALLDSSGRGSYLGPLLRDLRHKGTLVRSFTVTDHLGAGLVSNEPGRMPDHRGAPWVADVIGRGDARAMWADASRRVLRLAYPVKLPASTQPDGALVCEVELGAMFGDAAAVLPAGVAARLVGASAQISKSWGGPSGAGAQTAAARLQAGTLIDPAFGLSVEVALPRDEALGGLDRMTQTIVVAGLLALLLATAAAHWAVQRLLEPLQAMSAAARRIRDERRFDLAVPGQGSDEIGTLALSFNDMLSAVREGQANLEGQVAARTAALERTREHLHAVQRQMNDALLVVDEAGRIEIFSGAAERLFDLTAPEALTRGVARLIPEWFALKAGAAVEVAEQGRFQRNVRARRGDGDFAAEVSVALMHHQGRAQWIVLVRDNTEQQQAQVRMEQQHQLLEASVRQLRRQDEDMARINAMNELLAACEGPAEAHAVIERSLGLLFAGHAGALAVQRADGALDVVARWGEAPVSQAQFALADCWALRLGRLHDARAAGAPPCRHCSAGRAGLTCLPLAVHGESIGVLMTAAAADAGPDEQRRVAALQGQVGETVKSGLANLKLREALRSAALRDALTGLFNRRYFNETAPREVQRVHRGGKPLSLAMLDLDQFKRFNDEYGHDAGDLVLKATARVLAEGLRATDIVCRLGGEELVALLPDANVADAAVRMDVICGTLAGMRIEHRGRALPPVTVSIGIAQAPEHGSTVEALMRAADEALYRAKAEGRNRVVLAEGVPLRARTAA
jgi:diguanylate cyclase (GGDEF)-like protein/PAS domain S-box-containing protein